MKNGYVYLQPKYVSFFKCDGKKCPANCCCRDWQVIIDDETYKKYLNLESSEHELTKNLSENNEGARYLINHIEGKCPFMKNNLCSIQIEYGEKYLSKTCMIYPRQMVNFGEIIERTLTPTCPLAAELILNTYDQLAFEFKEVRLPEWAHGQLFVGETSVPEDLYKYIVEIQLTAISVLQEKRLTIEQRLILLGFYFFQIEEAYKNNEFDLIPTLDKYYTSEEFFKGQAQDLLNNVRYDVDEFSRIFFGTMERIYGDEKILKTEGNKKYIEIFNRVMNFNPFDKEQNFYSLANYYYKLRDVRKKFTADYQVFFENYLVNDFFGGVYPFKVEGGIQNNFAVFVMNYKILESIALAMVAENQNKDMRGEIFEMLCNMSMDLNHNENYISTLARYLSNQCDAIEFSHIFLQEK